MANEKAMKLIHSELNNVDETSLRELMCYILETYREKYENQSANSQTPVEYMQPKKTSKKRRMDPGASTSVITTNNYEVLSDYSESEQMEEDAEEEDQMGSETASKQETNDDNIKHTATHNNKVNTRKQTNPGKTKIAPIIIKETAKWTQTSKLMKINNISAIKSKVISTGIQVEPSTEEDYRKLSKLLKEQGTQYYTYQLKSEKKLKIVLRGVPQDITDEEIIEDLKEQDYPIDKTTRMKGKNGLPAPLVLVEISRDYKSIFNLTEVCGLAIKVESLRTRTEIVQCHKCQLFGHTQANCNIDYRCMKCGGDHSTHLCTKPKTTAPKCANCAGEHLSTFIKCPQNPNNAVKKKFIDAPLPKENPWFKKRQDQKIEAKPQNPPGKKEDELANILGRMILNFNKTKSTQEQQIQFLQQTQEITALFNN